MQLVVARIGKAHGLRGDVVLDVRTDDPDRRFAPGTTLATQPDHGHVTIDTVRQHQGRWIVSFTQTADRTAAEALRGVELTIEAEASDEEDAWYPHELVGLRAEDPSGRYLGDIAGLEYAPAHDLLILQEPSGHRTLVPFVHAIVPEVDLASGRVVIDPPGGLLAGE